MGGSPGLSLPTRNAAPPKPLLIRTVGWRFVRASDAGDRTGPVREREPVRGVQRQGDSPADPQQRVVPRGGRALRRRLQTLEHALLGQAATMLPPGYYPNHNNSWQRPPSAKTWVALTLYGTKTHAPARCKNKLRGCKVIEGL